MDKKIYFLILILLAPLVAGVCNECIYNGQTYCAGDIVTISGVSSYCNLATKVFLPQKPLNSSCQNDFECLNSQCLTGECANIVQTINTNQHIVNLTNISEHIILTPTPSPITYNSYSLTASELSSGWSKTVAVDDRFQFKVSSKTYTIVISQISSTKISIRLTPPLKSIDVPIGSIAQIDVNSDGSSDISFKLSSVTGNNQQANITIKSVTILTPTVNTPPEPVIIPDDGSLDNPINGDIVPTTNPVVNSVKAIVWVIIIILIVAIVVLGLLIFWIYRKNRQGQPQVRTFRIQ